MPCKSFYLLYIPVKKIWFMVLFKDKHEFIEEGKIVIINCADYVSLSQCFKIGFLSCRLNFFFYWRKHSGATTGGRRSVSDSLGIPETSLRGLRTRTALRVRRSTGMFMWAPAVARILEEANVLIWHVLK